MRPRLSRWLFAIAFALPLLYLHRPALAATAVFTNANALTVPLGAPLVTLGVANTFPSTITVSGVPASIRKLSVTLSGVSHTSSGDLDVLLVGPGGQQVVLMSDAGTQSAANISLTFDDDAAASLPASGALTSGVYRPTNHGLSDLFPQPAPILNYGTTLSVFNNTNPNGTWKLFVIDDALADVGSIAGWSLSLTDDVPAALGDSYAASVNAPLSVSIASGLLSNDTGALLTAVVEAGPAHGVLVLLPNGSFIYTPALNYVGSDSFTYRALNAAGGSNIATVSLIVGGGLFSSSGALVVDEDTPASGTLVAGGDNGGRTFSVVTPPVFGTLSITDPSSGAYTYTPAPNYSGPDVFTFKASSGLLDSNIAAVTIDVRPVNDPPTLSVPAAVATAFNTPLGFAAVSGNALLVSDVDIGLGALTLEITATHGTFIRPGLGNVSNHFSLVGTPIVLTLALEGLIFVPDTNYAGSASIVVSVSDNGYSGSGGALVAVKTIGVAVQLGVQSITFPNPGAHVYGDVAFALGATASSGLPVSYSVVSGPASVANGLLTITGAGSVTVRALQLGNGIFGAALSVEQTFSVAKAALTVRADNKVKLAGTANPPLSASFQGFVNGDGVVDLDVAVALATDATDASLPGSYAISVGAASDLNYTITFQNGTLTVTNKKVPAISWGGAGAGLTYGAALGGAQLNATAADGALPIPGTFTYTPAPGTLLHAGNNQALHVVFTPQDTATYAVVEASASVNVQPAPLTIAAANASKLYGAGLPALAATYQGFVNGDDAGDLDTPVVLNTEATAASPVGSYAITVGAADADYAISTVNGALSVAPAALTITANDLVRKAGEANPPLTAAYDGFVNGDDASDLDAPVALTTTATGASPVGSYAITPSGAADANYTVAFVSGTLTVTDKEIPAISWDVSAPIVYGTGLSAAQLNATSKVPGTFTFATPSGTVLHAGNNQVLRVTFTPEDTSAYATVTAQAVIDVLPAPLTIRADNKTMVAGGELPALTASYQGFVNGDTAASLDAPVRLNTTATAGSPAGAYPITASGAADNDYAISFANGSLAVTPKTASVYRVLLPIVYR